MDLVLSTSCPVTHLPPSPSPRGNNTHPDWPLTPQTSFAWFWTFLNFCMEAYALIFSCLASLTTHTSPSVVLCVVCSNSWFVPVAAGCSTVWTHMGFQCDSPLDVTEGDSVCVRWKLDCDACHLCICVNLYVYVLILVTFFFFITKWRLYFSFRAKVYTLDCYFENIMPN